jgi:hypothetical protein
MELYLHAPIQLRGIYIRYVVSSLWIFVKDDVIRIGLQIEAAETIVRQLSGDAEEESTPWKSNSR